MSMTTAVSRPAPRTVVLGARELTKSYGGSTALRSVDFELVAGEIHAVIGENGAGKSTLIKCLSGAVEADSGVVEIRGEPVSDWSPAAAQRAGVAVVHQELSLFPALTVAENLLGRHISGLSPWVNWSGMFRDASTILAEFGLDVDPRSRVEQLSIGQQQMVEIARALSAGADVVILDEPTSSLGPAEAARLFELVHRAASRGTSFVLITHFLEDVMAHSDRITVLRNGMFVGRMSTSDVVVHDLVQAMIGDTSDVIQATYEGAAVALPGPSQEPVILSVQSIAKAPTILDMSFEIRAGEVVGIFGDLAAGHMDVAEMLFGASAQPSKGRVFIDGTEVRVRHTSHAKALGIAYIPGDRRDALALDQPIGWNVTLAHLGELTGFFLRRTDEETLLQRWVDKLRIRGVRPHMSVGALSGGNQQKLLLARWLERSPKLLVLVEPTRGMDVGAKSDVVRIVRDAASSGVAVLVISAEPETVLTFADHVFVARRGRIVREFIAERVSKSDLIQASHQEVGQ